MNAILHQFNSVELGYQPKCDEHSFLIIFDDVFCFLCDQIWGFPRWDGVNVILDVMDYSAC